MKRIKTEFFCNKCKKQIIGDRIHLNLFTGESQFCESTEYFREVFDFHEDCTLEFSELLHTKHYGFTESVELYKCIKSLGINENIKPIEQ